MNIKEVAASIKICPPENGKRRIDIKMSFWKTQLSNGNIIIKLTFFGGIETIARNEDDVDRAIEETLTCFFNAISKSPNGVSKELKELGWQAKRNAFRIKKTRPLSNLNPDRFDIASSHPVFHEIMKTGINKTLSLSI